ncbi:tetratricopeptide repeat protein [bacterium]|nr:tetratricopeptide repeat protein [bacterium]
MPRFLRSLYASMIFLIVFEAAIASTANAQTDEIRFRPATGQTSGRVVRGTINAETPREVRIQVGNKPETVPIEEIAEINYAGTPPAFLEARVREKAGDYRGALENYEKAAAASGLKPFVGQLVKFSYAAALAASVSEDESRSDKAIKALQDFVKTYPNGRHTASAYESLLNLVRSGGDDARIDSVIDELAKVPGEQARAKVLKADTLVDQGKAEEALRSIDSVGAQIPADSSLARLAESVRIKSLVGTKKLDEAESKARQLIEAADPADSEALAHAYNALGDCLRASGKPKDALIAYLHTDILFDSVPNEHARALAAITQLWRTLEKPDRAEQTLSKLATAYPRSPWLKKAQGTP